MSDGEIVAIPPAKIKEGGRRRTMQKVATVLSHSWSIQKNSGQPCLFIADLAWI